MPQKENKFMKYISAVEFVIQQDQMLITSRRDGDPYYKKIQYEPINKKLWDKLIHSAQVHWLDDPRFVEEFKKSVAWSIAVPPFPSLIFHRTTANLHYWDCVYSVNLAQRGNFNFKDGNSELRLSFPLSDDLLKEVVKEYG